MLSYNVTDMALFMYFTAACLLLPAVLTEAGYCQTYCQRKTGGACVYCRRPTFGKRVQSSTELFPQIDRTPDFFEDESIDLQLQPDDKCILSTSLLEEMSPDSRRRVIETIYKAVNNK